MVDKLTFIYTTKKAGFSLEDAAHAMGLSVEALYNRLNGKIQFKIPEIESWALLTGSKHVEPVFFPTMVAKWHHPEAADEQKADA